MPNFIQLFTERLHDSYVQNWNSTRHEMSKLSLYNLYKNSFGTEQYLLLNVPRRLRRFLAKFRTSDLNLEIVTGRHYGIERAERLCKLCLRNNDNRVEDEFHFLLECPAYKELREIYLGHTEATLFYFCSILMSDESSLLICLANYICSAFQVRCQKLNEQ